MQQRKKREKNIKSKAMIENNKKKHRRATKMRMYTLHTYLHDYMLPNF